MASFVKRLAKSVAANTTEKLEYVPADGEAIHITRFISSGIYCSPDVKAEALWDGALKFAGHGSFHEWHNDEVLETFVGDGIKKLTVQLVNDSDGDESMQVGIYGESYGP